MASRPTVCLKFAFFGCLVAVTATSVALGATRDDSTADETAADGTEPTDSTGAKAKGQAKKDRQRDQEDGDTQDVDEEDEVVSNSPEKKTVSGRDKTYSHGGQFNLRLALGGSYRIVMRYDDSPPCSETLNDQGDPRTLCGFGAPMTLDTAIGFAPIAGVEPFLWGRFGLGKETVTNTTPLVILGAGARLYTMSDSAFKFFIEPAVGIELDKETSPKTNLVMTRQPPQHKQDFIVRLTIGPQYDFARNFGAYLGAGLTVGMLRSLQSWMDIHVGIQARFP